MNRYDHEVTFIMNKTNYFELISEIKELIRDVPYPVTNYANTAAAIYRAMSEINWAGFYLLEGNTLILGPFQGNPACVSIPLGKGVCGTALQQGQTLIVPDVHQFPGHIACDAASRSEIVIPMIRDHIALGVLDIDSPVLDRFDDEDRVNLEKIVSVITTNG